MLEKIKNLKSKNMHCEMIAKQLIQIKEKIIVVNALENGEIRVYELIGGSLNIQQLTTGFDVPDNVSLVSKIIVNELWKEKGLFIHKILCKNGYENLAETMIYQVLDFAEFHNQYQTVGISDREYERWFPYAKNALKNFNRENRTYVYYTR